MKTYVLMISRKFPATHKQKGQPTFFIEKIYNKIAPGWREGSKEIIKERKLCPEVITEKRHTIRGNYELWKKRIDEVVAGNAVLSLRYWSGSPYNYKKDGSKQVEFARLDKESGIGIQKLVFCENDITCPYVFDEDNVANRPMCGIKELAENDGLPVDSFKEWFRTYDLSEPMAIIHFTSFRY